MAGKLHKDAHWCAVYAQLGSEARRREVEAAIVDLYAADFEMLSELCVYPG